MLPELPETIVPPHKPNLIYRALTRWTHLNLPLKLISMILFLGLCAAGLYYAVTDNGQIASINIFPLTSTPEINEIKFPTASPSCNDNILSLFQVSDSCGPKLFRKFIARCSVNNTRISSPRGNTECKTVGYWLTQAERQCPAVCPSPSSTPSPSPSLTPSPSANCVQPPACAYAKPACKYIVQGVIYCPLNPSVEPQSQCVPAPEECRDASGNYTLCDPQPGITWCPLE